MRASVCSGLSTQAKRSSGFAGMLWRKAVMLEFVTIPAGFFLW
jgi:hypothetical protein